MILNASHRRWMIVCAVLFIAATIAYIPYHRGAQNGPSGGSWPGIIYGSLGFALMIYAGLIGARRKVPTWRLGRASSWMKGHLWLGTLSFPLIVYHSGFQFGGTLTFLLMALFSLVILSGIFGVIVQQFLPRMMMTQVPLETIYEQIDSVISQLQLEADDIVQTVGGALPIQASAVKLEPRAGGGLPVGEFTPRPSPRPKKASTGPLPGGVVLKEIYLSDIRAFLNQDLPVNGRLSTPANASALFQHLRTILPPTLHDIVTELEAICVERRQIHQQKRLHHWMHGWLLIHVPLSLALLALSAAHAVMALRY